MADNEDVSCLVALRVELVLHNIVAEQLLIPPLERALNKIVEGLRRWRVDTIGSLLALQVTEELGACGDFFSDTNSLLLSAV